MKATLRDRVSQLFSPVLMLSSFFFLSDLPNTPLIMLIPKRQVVNQARKQPRLKHAQQEPHRRHAAKALRAAQRHGHGAPAKHEKGEPAGRPQLLEENVGGHLKDGVGDEKDHEGNDKLVVGHAGGALHVVARGRVEDLGVANVGAVHEAEKVDARGDGHDAEVLAADEAALVFGGGGG